MAVRSTCEFSKEFVFHKWIYIFETPIFNQFSSKKSDFSDRRKNFESECLPIFDYKESSGASADLGGWARNEIWASFREDTYF